MPLTPLFTTNQIDGSPSVIVLQDISTGSDVSIAERRIYLKKSNGSYLVPSGVTTSYIPWALGTNPISVDVLNKDYALSILITWNAANGDILYSKEVLTLFTLYNKSYFYYLTQVQADNISITQDSIFFINKTKLWTFITSAENAVVLASDQAGAQNSLDAATFMIKNEAKFY